MWMAYVKVTPAYDLISAVENLKEHFENLEFDAEHEAVYGMEKFYTAEECKEIAKKYRRGVEACDIYLNTSDIKTFTNRIKELDLNHFLNEVKKFIPKEISEENVNE